MAAFVTGNVLRSGRILLNNAATLTSRMCFGAPPHMLKVMDRASSPLNRCVCQQAMSTSATGSKLTSAENRLMSFSTSPAVLHVEEEEPAKDVMQKINSQLSSQDLGRLFAVVHVHRNQRKITEEDILVVDMLYEADIGEKVRLNKVMMVGGADFTLLGRPLLSPNIARVEAVVLEKTLQHNKVWFAYKRRKSWKKMKLIRYPQTFLRITSIEVGPLEGS